MYEFTLPDMGCQHCVNTITETLTQADPTVALRFELPSHKLEVTSQLARSVIARKLEELGYPPAE
ncbi:heavy-metal-associated domain-containing protein [Pseudaeromonas paramecii]|uniref:HMA domain-containing protein n=1 Tax=Pseudaeromonas paramecii TaxID=2138166 RepID=A0ABP8Q3M8_9GAMM